VNNEEWSLAAVLIVLCLTGFGPCAYRAHEVELTKRACFLGGGDYRDEHCVPGSKP
jgi:hypothetical protein